MRVPPYTTKTGVQIGVFYEPPRQHTVLSADMERLQIALLRKPQPRRWPLLDALVRVVFPRMM